MFVTTLLSACERGRFWAFRAAALSVTVMPSRSQAVCPLLALVLSVPGPLRFFVVLE